MSIIQNTLDNIDKNQNYTQNTNNLIHNVHGRANNALKYNCNNKIEIITYKIPIDYKKNENMINQDNENKTNEIYSKNNNNNLYLINSFSNEEYTKSINCNSSEIIIKCKPMINSTASKSFMKEYSISKRYQEDKSLFPSIGETEIIPENEKIKEIEIEKSISNKSDTEKDEEDNNDIDLDFQELLEYQEKNLPIPIELKDNENYKILKIKEMKRLSMPPYKSVKKYGEEIKAKYEKDFRINIFYSSIKKKKPINSLKRLYSSNFPLNKNKKEIERFMIFRDKDIGIYEYWQAHLHETHIDEDIETDDEQKIIARNFCISEIKQAFDYINLNRNISFVNFNRYKSYFNNNESEKIMEQIINNLEYYNLSHSKGFSN